MKKFRFKSLAVAALILACGFASCSKDNGGSGSEQVSFTGKYSATVKTQEALSPTSIEKVIEDSMNEAITRILNDQDEVSRNSTNDAKVISACDLIYQDHQADTFSPAKGFSIIIYFEEDDDESVRQVVKRYDFLPK